MGTQPAQVGVEPGIGLVGRFGDTVILIAGDQMADGAVSDELLEMIDATTSGSELPGPVIAARLARWVVGRVPPDDLAFGVVAPLRDGLVVLLRGAVWGEVTSPDATHRLSGQQAVTWIDQVFAGTVERVAISSTAGPPAQIHPRFDLRGGVVPGRGFVLTRPGAGPAGVSGAESAQSFAVASPDDTSCTEPVEAAAPRTPVRETIAAAPPLGVLTSADGPAIPLDRSYVLGREPHGDPDVQRALASPIVVRDPDRLISRVHAYVWVEDGVVLVRDASSAGGSYIAAPGAVDWTRIGPDPTPLAPGWSIRIGKMVFVFEAAPTPHAGRPGRNPA